MVTEKYIPRPGDWIISEHNLIRKGLWSIRKLVNLDENKKITHVCHPAEWHEKIAIGYWTSNQGQDVLRNYFIPRYARDPRLGELFSEYFHSSEEVKAAILKATGDESWSKDLPK